MKEAFRVWPLLENLTKVDNILFTQEVFCFPVETKRGTVVADVLHSSKSQL